MLKCAAEYLAMRDEVVATKEAEARKKEEEKSGLSARPGERKTIWKKDFSPLNV